MEKTCFKCGIKKDLSEFYAHPQMGDGHLNKCKQCTKNDVRLRRIEHPEIVHEYDKRRYQEPERKQYQRLRAEKWRAAHPEKAKAQQAVHNAVRDKRLVKSSKCEICGDVCNAHGHHYDYSRPLDVIWLCNTCHVHIHENMS